jgi:hypothetical protein
MADNLSSDQQEFLEAACEIADRFNEYQIDEKGLMKHLGWDDVDKFSQIRNELEDAGYITSGGAPQSSAAGGFWISETGIELCPEPLGGRDALQIRD